MWKKIIISLIVIAVFVIAAVYFSGIILKKSDNGYIPNSISNSEMELKMYAVKNKINSSENEISFEVKNSGTTTVIYGEYYNMEKFKFGNWYKVPFRKDIGFSDVGFMVKPGETREFKITLSDLRYKLSKGKYRIIEEFTSTSIKKNVRLSAEFTIY